jgi:hypothetical protein
MATMPRPMRIPDAVWFSALERARREGTTLTAVVVKYLTRYGKG